MNPVEAIKDRIVCIITKPGKKVFLQIGEAEDEWGIKYMTGHFSTVVSADVRAGTITVLNADGYQAAVPGHQVSTSKEVLAPREKDTSEVVYVDTSG